MIATDPASIFDRLHLQSIKNGRLISCYCRLLMISYLRVERKINVDRSQ